MGGWGWSVGVAVNGTPCDCDSIGKADAKPHCTFVNFTEDGQLVFYGQAFNLFMMFWGVFFASALCDMVSIQDFLEHSQSA